MTPGKWLHYGSCAAEDKHVHSDVEMQLALHFWRDGVACATCPWRDALWADSDEVPTQALRKRRTP